jgi:hypothetical protein
MLLCRLWLAALLVSPDIFLHWLLCAQCGWFTALGVAASKGHTNGVILLIKAGADPNYQDSQVGL